MGEFWNDKSFYHEGHEVGAGALMDLMGMFVGAVVQGLIGLLFYLAVQRNMEKVDRLQERVSTMEKEKLAAMATATEKLEEKMEAGFKEESAKRKGLHEDIEFVRTHFVHVKACERMHTVMAAQFEKFSGAVIDLAKVQEKTEQTAKRMEQISEQVISLGQDISKMEGAHNG
jgi:hypothetical protein